MGVVRKNNLKQEKVVLANNSNRMKYKTSVKPRCRQCKFVRRKGRIMIRCANPRHNQAQG